MNQSSVKAKFRHYLGNLFFYGVWIVPPLCCTIITIWGQWANGSWGKMPLHGWIMKWGGAVYHDGLCNLGLS